MQTIIINLSALAEPKQISGLPASIMKLLTPNLARQWYSLEAFADLYTRFTEISWSKVLLSCCIFGSTTPGLVYVRNNIDWNIIAQYKLGELTTDAFLSAILEKMSFLLDADKEEVIKYLRKSDFNLQSLNGIVDLDNATNEQLAKALIEDAWLARMIFTEKTDENVKKFFEENKGKKIIFVANSNELDIRETWEYLKQVAPDIKWKKDPKLSVPKDPLSMGIELTDDHSVILYVSYAHHEYKDGVVSETSAKTDSLLERAVKSVNANRNEIVVISQHPNDLTKAKELVIPAENIHSAESYFTRLTSAKLKAD